jgi:glyoxylase-like metal-dependent hydrolase (beta-lactamase superfamily II)
MMIIERLAVGQLETNAYIIGDEGTKQGVVIDPGDEGDRIMDVVKGNSLEINAIVCTHAHFDHIGAAGDIRKETGAKILLHKDDLEGYGLAKEQASFWGFDLNDLPQPDDFIEEGDTLQVGSLSFKIMHTPGHSPGGISLYGEGIVLTGDTIFQGSVGRTDFPGGSIEKLKESFRRLLALPTETKVYSGHGPETTIGREKKENFFVSEFL